MSPSGNTRGTSARPSPSSSSASSARAADPGSWPDDLPADYDRALLEEGRTGLHLSPWDLGLLGTLEEAYETLHPATVRPADTPRIPLVLHQIWLGDRPLPDRFRRFREGWLRLHPSWEHRLWTDRDVADLDFEARDLFEEAENFGMKTVILRCEILRRFGGLYADVDYECLRPLDPFHHRYDFYGTLRVVLAAHLMLWPVAPRRFVIDSSLFGCVPGHPVLERYLSTVRRLWSRRDDVELGAWSRVLPRARRERLLMMQRTAQITGNTFGNTIARHMARADRDDRAVILPPSYFNPLDTGWNPWRFVSPLYWVGALRGLARGRLFPPHYVEVLPHTFAVHHSEATWL